VKYRGKELSEYSKPELIELLAELIRRDEARSRMPANRLDNWEAPQRVQQSFRGKGKPGGS
jgi:hypothetical protein